VEHNGTRFISTIFWLSGILVGVYVLLWLWCKITGQRPVYDYEEGE
jgi:hypothetical protein